MKKLLYILLSIFIIKINVCFADIITAHNIETLEDEIDKADKNSLILFDIDDVLIRPSDEFLFTHPIRKDHMKKLREKYSKDEIKILFSDFFQKRTVRLINDRIVDLINKIKQRKIPMAALTAWWTEKYGKIPKMEEIRFKNLNEVGISFLETSPFKETYSLPEFKTDGGTPMVMNGIIITATSKKGDVLKSVLERSNLKFDKIIFIDDNLSYLESVEKACKELNINFLGINYTEALSIPMPELLEHKEKIRFELLEKYHKWISDKELEELLSTDYLKN